MKQFMDKDFYFAQRQQRSCIMTMRLKHRSLTIIAILTRRRSRRTENLKISHRYGLGEIIINGV